MNSLKPAPRTERVTIRVVAADAGVSVAAVSKVLRSAYGVSEALRLKVTESIERLGYRPNVVARGMRGQTFTIGVLLVELANPFLPQIIDGVNAVLGPSSYKAMIGVGQSHSPIEASLIESMIDYRMDGLILVAPRLTSEVISAFAKQIPIVVIGHHEPTAQDFDTVNGDDRHGAALVVDAMLARGYRDLMMINLELHADKQASVTFQRELGFTDSVSAAGIAPRILHLSFDTEIRDAQMIALLTGPDRPRAIFCWSDLDAIHVINLCKKLGLAVPGDVAIVGYDNSPVSALPLIDLASIDQEGRRLGSIATKTLLSRIEGRNVANHFLLEPNLVIRSSI